MAEDSPRLYLITPPLADAAAFAPLLETALLAGDIACVLLRLQPLAASETRKIAATLVPLTQKHEAAALLEDPALAARCDADGVHVTGLGPALEAALTTMKPGKTATKPEKIVGIGGLAGRHDAMLGGESGVDYVMFGAPDMPEDVAGVVERIAWWAGIFTLPCVAYAHTLADVGPLAAAGADFIALGDAVWQHEQGVAAAIEKAMLALTSAQEPIP